MPCSHMVVHIAVISAGLAASYWNTLNLPERGLDSPMDDKTTYTTLVRVLGSWAMIGAAFQQLFVRYGWRHVVLVTDSVPNSCQVTPLT